MDIGKLGDLMDLALASLPHKAELFIPYVWRDPHRVDETRAAELAAIDAAERYPDQPWDDERKARLRQECAAGVRGWPHE